jgi:hypothetical protein
MKRVYEQGQNIIDFITQNYNSEDYLIDFLNLNDIEYNDFGLLNKYEIGETNINNYFINRNLSVKTGNEIIEVRKGDYNNDYNNDFFNQDLILINSSTTSYWTWETPTGLTYADTRVSIDEDFDLGDPLYGWIAPKKYYDAGFIKMSNYSDYEYDNRIYYTEAQFIAGEKYKVEISGASIGSSITVYVKFVNNPYEFNLNIDSYPFIMGTSYTALQRNVEIYSSAQYMVIEVRENPLSAIHTNIDRIKIKKIN